jgi:hypothetical protein
MYSTYPQEDLNVVDRQGGDAVFAANLKTLRARATETGSSNIFLVRGDSLRDAFAQTRDVFTYPRNVNRLPRNLNPAFKSENIWLVAFFGTSGSGGVWLVDAVDVSGRVVRVGYRTRETDGRDMVPYIV